MKKIIVPIVSVVALVVGLINLFSTAQPVQPVTSNLSGVTDVNTQTATYTSGIELGNIPVTMNWASGKIIAKQNQASWRNTTGMVQYVDLAEMSTDGTASSSYKFYAFATTTNSRTLYDFTAPANNGARTLINGVQMATSTVATTTTSLDFALSKVIQVPDGSYVNLLFTAANGVVCASSGGLCESATSTSRGFNVQWRLRYHN